MATKIDMIGLFVSDLPRMVAFYRNVLGFAIEWDGQGPYAEFQHDGVRFSMYERAQLPGLLGQAPSYPSGLNGTFELAIDLPTSADADAMFARVVAAGGRPVYAPRDEPWGMHSSMVADPEIKSTIGSVILEIWWGMHSSMVADPEGNLIEIGSWNRGAERDDS